MHPAHGSHLGHRIDAPTQYDPSLLFGIERDTARQHIPHPTACRGFDVWRAYEVSWLSPESIPQVAMLEIVVPSTSPRLVESKSLKLYLGSFNQHVVDNIHFLCAIITADLVPVLGVIPAVRPIETLPAPHLPGTCIDHTSSIAPSLTNVNGEILHTHDHRITETLHSRLLRSLCPVTGQPDWASVIVQYTGNKIDEASLLHYVIGFRNHQGFHEECVERIFSDIMYYCRPEHLAVMACFTRRGGIDINPFRSNSPMPIPSWRDARQ